MLALKSFFPISAIVTMVRAMASSSPSASISPSSSGDKSPSPSPSTSPPSPPSQPPRRAATRTTKQPPPFMSRKPRARRGRRPAAKGSLFDIMHQHAGTALFVRPICWTDAHTRLLGAQFCELPPCETPLPCNMPGSPPTQGHMRPSRTITTLSDALTEILLSSSTHPIQISNAVKTVLSTLWPTAFVQSHLLPELHVFFGGRVYHDAVRVQVMWNFPSDVDVPGCSSQSSFKTISTRPTDSYGVLSSSPAVHNNHNPANLPMLCYISKNQLAQIRKNLFRIASGPGKTQNTPVFRLQQLRAKQLVPADSDRDAHFVGIFLAMAQRHFYTAPVNAPSLRRESQWSPRKGRPTRPDFQDIKLRILTHDTDTSEFLVYTGHVTAKFLERFHDPLGAPCGDNGTEVPGIKIEYTRVPIWPILGLRERLGKALGEDVVGQFDPTNMETWEDDDAEPQQGGGKRKRDSLAEVFNNGSFDEESGGEEPELAEKKRCLEGTRVGVVV